MDPFEGEEQKGSNGSGNITDVLSEETANVSNSGSAAPVDTNDFAVTSPELPEEPAAEPAAAKKETVKEEKIIKPDGTTTETKITTIQQPVSDEQKSSAFARAFNGSTLILFGDILLRKIGGIVNPERPSEYWGISPQDKADFTLLLTATAQEESWKGIPSKWLLLFCVLIMLGGKIMYAKKMEYAFVPGEKGGSAKAPSEEKKAESETDSDKRYKALFIREKAMYEADMEYGDQKSTIEALRQQNDLLKGILEKAKKDERPGGGIQDIDFEMIQHPKHNNDHGMGDGKLKGNVFKDSQGTKWNLEKIEFTEKGAIIDRTKAGTTGYTSTGIKLGNISKGQWEAVHAWKLYRKQTTAVA